MFRNEIQWLRDCPPELFIDDKLQYWSIGIVNLVVTFLTSVINLIIKSRECIGISKMPLIQLILIQLHNPWLRSNLHVSFFWEASITGEAGGEAVTGQLQGALHWGVSSAWTCAAPPGPVTTSQSVKWSSSPSSCLSSCQGVRQLNSSFYLLDPGLDVCSRAAMGVCISILNLAVAVTLVTWPALGEALREEPVLEPWDTNNG